MSGENVLVHSKGLAVKRRGTDARMPGAELEMTTWTKLLLLAERARREPRCQFTSLAHLLDAEYLAACYHLLGRDRACGVDGVTWKEYGERLEENLRDLVIRMKAKRYKPQPAKRVYIPKDEHSQRPLGLPALEDKIVQKGIAEILTAIYEADFLDCSYGFRPGRGCHQALNAVDKTIMAQPINYVIDADIKAFFDSVSHAGMMRCLRVRIKDPNFLLLIERFLKAGYFEAGAIVATERGTPQGGNLSPMLSNIFLHYVLDLWFEKRIKRQVRGVSVLVRYADDFVCMTQQEQDAQNIVQAIRGRFAEFDLELHPEKTRVISFGRNERQKARRDRRRPNTFDFLGFTHYCDRNRRGKFMVGRKTSSKKFRKKCRELNEWLKAVRNACSVKEWWPTLKAKLTGHYQYYGISGNSRRLSEFFRIVVRMAWKWLNRRSQRRSFTWEQFWKYLKCYPLPEPRIVHKTYALKPVT
jgi:RNA-directed DNA polymerase